MSRRETAPKAIRDYFYETRVLMGREFTVKRFAVEVLEGAVDPVMLGYIEKGKVAYWQVTVKIGFTIED